MAVSANINTSVWDRIRARVAGIGHRRVGVGVFGDEELATIAASHEYGARIMRAGEQVGTLPERSYIRSALRENERELNRVMNRVATGMLNGSLTIDRGLGLLGLFGVNTVKAKIRSDVPPPLQPATVRRKGSSKALIDTARLLNSVRWEVVD